MKINKDKKLKLIGIIEGEAKEVQSTDEVGIWTDGVGLYYDKGPFAAFKIISGKKYKITVEEIK